MSSGLNNIIKPIEVSKEDWIAYEGVMYSPRTVAALKAAKTRKRNKHYAKYKTKTKDEQRDIIIDFLLRSDKEWNKYNHYPIIYQRKAIILETPELLFLKKLKKKCNGKLPIKIFIPNNKEFKKFICLKNCDCVLEGYGTNYYHYEVGLYNQSYLQFIKDNCRTYRDNNKFSVCMIWADYCGAFSSHTKDIEETFRSMLF